MTEADMDYVLRIVAAGAVAGPVLELGAGYGGQTCRQIVESARLAYATTDLAPGDGVDVAADFDDADSVARAFGERTFRTILVLNVLEHTLDPVRILDNALTLLSERGSLVIVTPAVWPIHDFPIDCCRLLPDFYVRYAKSRGMSLDDRWFEYVGRGRVREHLDENGRHRLPLPAQSRFRRWKSRVVHRLFDTSGRDVTFPSHVAVGAVLGRP